MSGSPPTQKQHIEALVLAFSHSRARSLVGTDALRTVISGQYRDMVRDDKFELESLWTLLEGQPGFDPASVKPPLCKFKTWEADLEIGVALPPQWGELTALEVRAFADECSVPHKELDRVLERGSFTKEERAARAAKWTEEPEVEPATPSSGPATARPVLLAVIAAVALISFGVAGYFVYDSFFKKATAASVSPSLFTGIPVKKAVRAGFDIRVLKLSNEAWFTSPESERRASLRNSLTELARDGIRGLLIFDKTGKVRAIAQTYGPGQSKMRIQFK